MARAHFRAEIFPNAARMERLDDAEDKRLMAALADGNDHALDQIIRRWQQPLRAFIQRSTGDEADTDDLLQETFVRVYKHRARYRPAGRFSTWLFTIAVNLCRNHADKRRRRPTVSLDAMHETSRGAVPASALSRQPSTDPIPSEQTLAGERAEAVRAAIGELPDDLRTAILLFEYENLSHAEIATIVNTTPKGVETRLYRARQHLREKLSRWLQQK
ncbi:MAG: RNA polymerase sigma factor [Opitutaceae bacterium]